MKKQDYRSVIAKNVTVKKKFNAWNKIWILPLIFFAIASVFAVLYFDSKNERTSVVDFSRSWKNLIESEKPTLLIIGDLFVYEEKDSIRNLVRTIQNPAINSLEEFQVYKMKNNQSDLRREPLTYSHLPIASSQWIKQLTEIFVSLNSDYDIQTISRFKPKNLKGYNIIVVGMQKTLGVFKSYWTPSQIKYDENSDTFFYERNIGENSKVYRPIGNPDSFHTDYGYMAKIPGPNNNTIHLFSGIWDTGVTQSLNNFTDPSLLSKLEQQLAAKFERIPEYYEVLFEVNGINRMELNSEILHVFQIEN